MKRTILFSFVLLLSAASARADYYEMNYRDLIRPHGHPRSDAIYQSNLDFCYSQTSLDRAAADTPAFKSCMFKRGYRWLSTRLMHTPSAPPPLQPGDTFIDPETGLSCHDEGGASICQSPRGTVHYTNKWGLNCTRNNFVAICSNL